MGLAVRMLWRQARSGQLALIFCALALAVTCATAIAVFSARIELAMSYKANAMLGADLRLESSSPLASYWLEQAQRLGLRSAHTTHFPTMAVAGDNMAMAAVKAVSANYPLQGELLLQRAGGDVQILHHGPAPGEAWVEPRLLALLQLQLGERIELGNLELTVSAVIQQEPDRGMGFYSLSPRLMISQQDLAASGLIRQGSRVTWRLLFAGEPAQIKALRQLSNEHPLAANEKFQTLEDHNQTLAARLSKAKQYLNLAALLAVLLAAVAMAISAKHYAQGQFKTSALLRALGLTQRQVAKLYVYQLVYLALLATACGLLCALALQQILLWLLADLVPQPLPAAPATAWLLGVSVGAVCLFGFTLPHLLPLARVSPLRILRRELQPLPLSSWLLSALALLCLLLLMWLFSGDLSLTLWLAVLGLGFFLCLYVVLNLILALLKRQLRNKTLGLSWRFAWLRFSAKEQHSAGQIIAFSLTFMVMLLILSLRNDLLADWQASLPADAPNIFAFNIQPDEVSTLTAALAAQDIKVEKLYPTTPGRLVKINSQAVSDLPIAKDNALNRDLILTSDTELPASNKLVAGDWTLQQQAGFVSVEEKLAERLGINLGDRLEFMLAGLPVSVTVSSLRAVDWGSMTPNFFMIFSAAGLQQTGQTYLTSFYLPADKSAALVAWIERFPSITFLDVGAVLSQIQSLLEQLTLAIELILIFVLAAALLVLLAALLAGREQRLKEAHIIRALGGSRGLLRQAQWLEFSLLAVSSALFALAATELIRWFLYHEVLSLAWHSLGFYWLGLPLAAWLLINVSAARVLR